MLGASVGGKVEVEDIKFLSSTFSSFCFLGTFDGGELWSLKPFDFLTTSFGIARFAELVFLTKRITVLRCYTSGCGRI